MNNNIYQAGNTIRLKATFKDFDGVLTDPTILKVILYDYKYNSLEQYVPTKIGVGTYILDYPTPAGLERKIIYEWYGEIDGNPSLRRGSFRTVFI